MGVLNVTPDSFSDGGCFVTPEHAVRRALQMIDEGAGIIDVGPESTRPGAASVSEDEQIARAVPVIDALRRQNRDITISIDTTRAKVARAAIIAGADIVNDISALTDDPRMAEVIAETGASVVLMHMRGAPPDMQRHGGPAYADVMDEVCGFLEERRAHAMSAGIDKRRLLFDPGLGFGKRFEHNLTIMRHLDRFVALGQPLVVGASRKSFIGNVLQISDPADRDVGSLACASLAVMAGAAVIRAHAVAQTVQAVRMAASVRDAVAETSDNQGDNEH